MSRALKKTTDEKSIELEVVDDSELTALPAPTTKRSWKRILFRLVMMGAVPLLAIFVAGTYWLEAERYVGTQNAYIKTNIAKLAAEVSGKAIEVRAYAHMKVTRGDILVKIDPQPFELSLAQAQAELDAARQEMLLLRSTLVEAEMEIKEAEHRFTYYRRRYERQLELAKGGIVSGTRSDELENDANEAQDKITLARQKWERVRISLGGSLDNSIDDHPTIKAKIAARDKAKLDLEHTIVRAPLDGTVVTVPLVSGDQITAAKPLFAIVANDVPWVDANFKETDLTYVRVGQSATIELDTYPGVSWQAKVKSISPATGSEFSILPPQNASGNWVKVVQRLPIRLQLDIHENSPPLRAGMTAKVTIDTARERTFSDLLQSWKANAMTRLPD